MTCRDGAPPRQGGQRARERRDKATGQAPGSRAWPSPGVVAQAAGQPSSRRVGGSCKKRPREPFCGSFPNSTSLRLHLPLRRPGLVLGPTPGTCGGRRRGPSGAGAVPRGRWAVRAEGRSQDAPTTPRKRQSAGLLLRKSDAKRRPRTCQEQQGRPAHQHGRRLEPSAPRGDVRGNSSTDEGPGAPEGNSACRVSDRTRTQPGQPSAGQQGSCRPRLPSGEGCGAHRPPTPRPQRPCFSARGRALGTKHPTAWLAALGLRAVPLLCVLIFQRLRSTSPTYRAPLSSWKHGSEIVRGRQLCKREMDGLTQVQGQSWKSRGRGARQRKDPNVPVEPGLKARGVSKRDKGQVGPRKGVP